MTFKPTDLRFCTKKLGLSIFKKQFTARDGSLQHSQSWYWTKMVAGQVATFPLGYNKREAEKLAEEIASFISIPTNTLDMAEARYNPRKAARANKVATFTDILEAYGNALPIIGRKGKAVSASTFKGYRSFLATMLRKVEAFREGKEFKSFFGQNNVDYSPWFDQPIDLLTAKFVMDFKLCSMPPAPEGEDEPDEEEALVAKISADTALRCARALFSKQALRYYREVKLNLPDLSGFMAEPDFGAKKYFQILPPEVIVNIVRASIALRDSDEDAYRAYLLTMHCGLRRGEAEAFKLSWMRDEDRPTLYVTVRGKFNPKHGHGRRVIIETWVADALKQLGPVRDAASLDRLNDWVKGLIPKEHGVGKPLHELRKCWVSCKAKTDGIHAAATQAGHKDVKVTTTHYADNQMPDRLIALWKEPTAAAILRFEAA